MFEHDRFNGDVAKSMPEELERKLLDLLGIAVNDIKHHRRGTSMGRGMFLNDPESVDFIARYFEDEGYKDVAEKYPGLPIHVDTSDEGIVVIVGIRPYKDGVPVDGPSEDGLPYAVSIVPFEAAEEFLAQQTT